MQLFQAWLTCALALFVSATSADQNDPRLDKLFEQLQEAQSGPVPIQITHTIWQLWTETDDPEAEKLMETAAQLMSHQRYQEALEPLHEVVLIAPDYAEGWNRRATVYYLLGDYSSSASDVRKTLELEPRHFGALSGLGLLYLETESYEAALVAFRDALRANPHLHGPKLQVEELKKKLQGTEI